VIPARFCLPIQQEKTMFIIQSAADMSIALFDLLTLALTHLLAIRREQLLSNAVDLGDLAHWIIVQPGDPLSAISGAVGPLPRPRASRAMTMFLSKLERLTAVASRSMES